MRFSMKEEMKLISSTMRQNSCSVARFGPLGRGGVAGFALASVHHRQEQTLVKGDPVDVAGCHSCGRGAACGLLREPLRTSRSPAASGPVQKHAQTLCAVTILGVRAVHDFAKDVLHGLPLARCCRSWLLGGQKVEPRDSKSP